MVAHRMNSATAAATSSWFSAEQFIVMMEKPRDEAEHPEQRHEPRQLGVLGRGVGVDYQPTRTRGDSPIVKTSADATSAYASAASR